VRSAAAAASLCLTIPLCLGAQAPASQSGVTKFTSSGIPVLFKPVTANDVIAVRLYLKGGSANLTPKMAGIERLIGETSTRGTQKYAKEVFDARSVTTGSTIGATATYDYSVFTLQAVRQHWDEAWDLLAEAVMHPTFPAAELELVREQVINELRQHEDNPDAHLDDLADSILYAGHPYAVASDGTIASVKAITRDDLVKWHDARLTKENLLLVVVGNVTRADLEKKIAAALGSLPATGGTAKAVGPAVAKPGDVKVVQRDLPTNYILGVFPVPNLADRDFPAFRLGMAILSDRLFEEVRTKRNLTYAVSTGVSNRRANQGNLYVTAVQPDTTLKVMLAEVRRLQREPLASKRLGETVNEFLTLLDAAAGEHGPGGGAWPV
jgi:zinc protease